MEDQEAMKKYQQNIDTILTLLEDNECGGFDIAMISSACLIAGCARDLMHPDTFNDLIIEKIKADYKIYYEKCYEV